MDKNEFLKQHKSKTLTVYFYLIFALKFSELCLKQKSKSFKFFMPLKIIYVFERKSVYSSSMNIAISKLLKAKFCWDRSVLLQLTLQMTEY